MKRTAYSNTYYLRGGKRRTVLGGVPNVPYDDHGNLAPLDNEVVITTNPIAKYVIKRGPFLIGFHDRQNNKYGVAIKLRTGETLIKRAIGDPVCTPTVIDKRTLQWQYANGSWIREYATEKKIKEVIFQKKGQVIKFRYTINGFTVKKVNKQIEFYKGNRLAFTIHCPYYCTKEGEFISYVSVSWQKVGNDWVVTYPAPATNKFIDPVIVFGEGAGHVGGDHKDTWFYSVNNGRCFPSAVDFRVANVPVEVSVLRYSLTGHIPINAIINNSVLSLTLFAVGVAAVVSFHNLLTAWGVTQVAEGITENPATGGQATRRRSFDFNGAGGDVAWVGGLYGAGDRQAAETAEILVGGEPAPATILTPAIPIMTQAWVQNDNINYGLSIESNGLENRFYSQEAANAALRPYLTVDYDIPSRRIDQTHISIQNAMGIH